MKKFIAAALLGLGVLVAAQPTPADAGFFHFGGIGWRGHWWSPRVYHGGWRANYYYADPGVTYSNGYSAYYPQEQPVDANTATIRLQVPEGARVWFDGEATSQSGADRIFVSPALTPGYAYSYHIRVQWHENGQAVERTRDITVHAGDRINVQVAR
jgi:uncharacterized protein (TIGR03000 family)